MRITQKAMVNSSLTGLNNNLTALVKVQNQLATGRVLNRPSDSPIDTNKSMQVRSDLGRVAQQDRNITDAQSRLDQTDSALQGLQDLLKRVQALTVQGLNTGGNDATSSAALATELTALRADMLGVANTSINGRPIFGGVTSGAVAYQPDGSYAGLGQGEGSTQDHPVLRRISDNEVLRVDVTGPEVFGPDGANLFAVVQGIADKLNTSPVDVAALSADLAALDAAQDRISTAQATVGARSSRVQKAAELNITRELALNAQRKDIEDVDIPKASMELSAQQLGYQASLAVTAKILQPTLMEFLR
ncbi:flagellar hook-associated protein FlgL [Modestobacter marinus]|uniref:flagellar hook-associated protein FlgL n=1 Tax=Modestobacter marinus TaxID=477641 RepID=UPI001C96DDFE|nr:flagellar hook-associated protein FlgL [Modestobacter marinus]